LVSSVGISPPGTRNRDRDREIPTVCLLETKEEAKKGENKTAAQGNVNAAGSRATTVERLHETLDLSWRSIYRLLFLSFFSHLLEALV